ncbi:MAG: hypothetical protein KC736_02685, partial [Candidatus Moranbacteria bacterium]|nr:hypothetical protein [Candidatus Moranbacteria bacterium]
MDYNRFKVEKIILCLISVVVFFLVAHVFLTESDGGVYVVFAGDHEDEKDDEDEEDEYEDDDSNRSAEEEYEVVYEEVGVPVVVESSAVLDVATIVEGVGALEGDGQKSDETIINDDGTRIERTVSTANGVIVVAEDFYDGSDHKVRHINFVRDADGVENFSIDYFDFDGNVMSGDFIETNDGKFVQIINPQIGAPRTRFYYEQKKIVVEIPSDVDVMIGSLNNKFTLTLGGQEVRTLLPLFIDDTTGEIFFENSEAERFSLKIFPQGIFDIVRNAGLGEDFEKIDVVETENGRIAYIGKTVVIKKLLGLFVVDLE